LGNGSNSKKEYPVNGRTVSNQSCRKVLKKVGRKGRIASPKKGFPRWWKKGGSEMGHVDGLGGKKKILTGRGGYLDIPQTQNPATLFSGVTGERRFTGESSTGKTKSQPPGGGYEGEKPFRINNISASSRVRLLTPSSCISRGGERGSRKRNLAITGQD